MKVICISGKAQHGKDTTAAFMQTALEEAGKRVLIAHYGDLLKYICKTFFAWDGQKDEAGRTLLQRVGTDVIRKSQPDFWVVFVFDILKLFPAEWDYVLIPDCRFPNEILHARASGLDVLTIRINRSGFESPLTPEQQQHISETALDDFPHDHELQNSGTLAELEQTVRTFMAENGLL